MADELRSVKVETFGPITRIRCSIDTRGGWIHAYLDDETGTLAIVSDYGDWSHRWGISGLPDGETFSQFILGKAVPRREWHYVASKIVPPERSREPDMRATRSIILRRLAFAARRRIAKREGLSAHDYRCAVEAALEAETFDDIYNSGAIGEFVSFDPDDMHEKASHEFETVYRRILPAIGRAWWSAAERTTEVPR